MAVEISTHNYGLCLFSMPNIKAFLKEKKIRSKKVLEAMQKKKDIYLDSIGKGVWLPIVRINCGHYRVCVDGVDEDYMLEQGKKYSICEMTKKRDQKIFKELGTLTIED